jgi:hypothetical protein
LVPYTFFICVYKNWTSYYNSICGQYENKSLASHFYSVLFPSIFHTFDFFEREETLLSYYLPYFSLGNLINKKGTFFVGLLPNLGGSTPPECPLTF